MTNLKESEQKVYFCNSTVGAKEYRQAMECEARNPCKNENQIKIKAL